MSIEKYKEDVMSEEFRQYNLYLTSAEGLSYDETKKPNYQPPQESFRKLNVDWLNFQSIVNPVFCRR